MSWGATVAPTTTVMEAEEGDEGSENGTLSLADPRSASDVRRCLVERAIGLPRASITSEHGDVEESPGRMDSSQRRRYGVSPTALAPLRREPASCSSIQPSVVSNCAVQYRLLKRKGVATESSTGGTASESAGADVSSSAHHDLGVGPLRVQLTEAFLEQLVKFSGIGRCDSDTVWVGDSQGEGGGSGGVGSNAQPQITAAESSAQGGLPWRDSRPSPVAASVVPGRYSPRAAPAPPATATSETSLHLVLLSVDVALDMTAPCKGHEERGDGTAGPLLPSVGRAAFLVLSLERLGIRGSESASLPVEAAGQQQHHRPWHGPAYNRLRREDAVRQRVCSLSLDDLSVKLVDDSALAAADRAREERAAAPLLPPLVMWDVLFASAVTAFPSTQRLVALGGVRVTAEIISKAVEAPFSEDSDGRAAAGAGAAARSGVTDFLFNASCESVHLCASVGGALLLVEACLLARTIIEGGSTGDEAEGGAGTDGGGRASARGASDLQHGWRHGLSASFEGVSVGGAVKSGGGELTGNMRRLSMERVGSSSPLRRSLSNVASVAVFEAPPGEGVSEGLSWSLEALDAGGSTDLKLAADFTAASLHYANAKAAYKDMKVISEVWQAGVSSVGLFSTGAGTGVPAAGDRSHAVERGRDLSVGFDIRGSSVTMQLPFDLLLEVNDVRIGSRPLPRAARVGRSGRLPDNRKLVLDLLAGDVRVFHALYGGTRCLPEDAQPPVITCAARGVVTLTPSSNATSVSLHSEHVYARLTPAFCAAFGSFVRFMVGPPSRRTFATSTAASLTDGVDRKAASCFEFGLGVREVEVDFVTGPCSPWAVSANVLVGGLQMRQKSTAATSLRDGSQASFELSLDAVESTQRRDPCHNAPALPQGAIQLIRTFLEPEARSDGDRSGVDLFSAWLSARKRARRGNAADERATVQPFIVALRDGGATAAQAFSVTSTSAGPRHRLVNSLALRAAPLLLACYPPTVRLFVGHYNRFERNAFRSFRSRADLPPRRICVMSYDIDIRGCSAVLLASLAAGARGIHLSAGVVRVKKDVVAPTATTRSPGVDEAHQPTSVADATGAADSTLSMSGYVGPAGVAFVQDWRCLLPASAGAGSGVGRAAGANATSTQLCVPIDLRWTVCYDSFDRCRQDLSLSSVQLYLEQSHFDLCVRLAQIFLAADFPGALPLASRATPAATRATCNATESAAGDTRSSLSVGRQSPAADHLPAAMAANDMNGNNKVWSLGGFLNLSIRLPLLQVVLAMGKRNGPFPPVLEIDVASVRLARGGVLTVRHVSVKSWSQEFNRMAARSGAAETMRAAGGGGGSGYRVVGRSGQSEESGKDFVRMEVRVPEVRAAGAQGHGAPGTLQAQLDVVFQVSYTRKLIRPRYFFRVPYTMASILHIGRRKRVLSADQHDVDLVGVACGVTAPLSELTLARCSSLPCVNHSRLLWTSKHLLPAMTSGRDD